MKNNGTKLIKTAVCGIALLAAVICYIVYGFGSADPVQPGQYEEEKPESVFEESISGESDLGVSPETEGASRETASAGGPIESDADAAGMQKTGRIFIHVCGEVVSPGVYELEEGSRIYQAVEMAGGFTENAAVDFLNMAQVLEDGVQIQIPDREEAGKLREEGKAGAYGQYDYGSGAVSGQQERQQAGAAGKVNINTASKEQLMTLSGIGEARAEAVIAYRSERGPFGRIEDIMEVSGIKEAAFQKIREDITV